MSVICQYCGRELEDNAAFCDGCGAILDGPKKRCLSCGEEIPETATICPVCGAGVYNNDLPEGPAEMESLVPPVITDDMFAAPKSSTEEAVIDSADESQYIQSQPKPVPDLMPQPTPRQAPAPLLNERMRRPAPAAPVPEQPQPVIKEPPRPAAPAYHQQDETRFQKAMPQYQEMPKSTPQQSPYQQQYFQNGQQGYGAQPQYQQPMHSPYPDPASMNVKEGKKSSMLIPIILIILILGVIAFDVFFLFRDRIFGSDSSKSSKKSTAIVYQTEDLPESPL